MQSVYDMLGGEAPIRRLVDSFYAKIERDDVLRPMFPDDLETSKQRQFMFLVQYFGGPDDYSQERGHPRLRRRHFPFPIDKEARDRWLKHMLAAIDDAAIPEPARSTMREYFERASAFLINRHDIDKAE